MFLRTSFYMRIIYKYFFLNVLSIYTVYAVNFADFLVIREPERLSILDQYEQALSLDQKKAFLKYTPFQIMNKNVQLGDQITTALRCHNLGSEYFLLKNETGDLITNTKLSYQHTFTGCTVFSDTVEVTNENGTRIYDTYPSGGNSAVLSKGEKAIRIFQHSNEYCLFRLAYPQRYGWCSTSAKLIKKTQKASTSNVSSNIPDLKQRIGTHLILVNELYDSIFRYFNKLTQQQQSIPHWQVTIENNTIRCTLKGSYLITKQLEESTDLIRKEFEKMLLGEPFAVQYNKGEIIISPRQSSL